MKTNINIFKRFSSRLYSDIQNSDKKMEDLIKDIFYSSVNSVKPCELITKNKLITICSENNRKFIEIKNKNSLSRFDITGKRIHLVGFGKGVLAITAELESVFGGKLTSGVLSVPLSSLEKQSLSSSTKITVLEGAAGNLPDENALKAANEIKSRVLNLAGDDVLIVLITGGGSALLPLPIDPITLEEKTLLIKQLSRAGATINELNTVRIALSQVKGGKLAEMGRNANRIISLIVSDIINDPLDLIASGPTIAYQKPHVSPKEILEKYNLLRSLPTSIAKVISIKNQEEVQAPSLNSDAFLIGNNEIAIEAAMLKAKSFNLFPVFLSAKVQGNVIDVSQAFYELACAVKRFSAASRNEFGEKIARISKTLSAQSNFINDLVASLEAGSDGICIISGGETTVTVTGNGFGGRNQELALRFTQLCCLDADTSSFDDLLLLSAGTDGFDGNNDAAGSLGGSRILSSFINNADAVRVMQDFINRNDSYSFYKNALKNYAGDRYHIVTGHTGTNVMDLHLLLIMLKK